MAFDQPTRNRLGGLVSDARAMLVEEFTRQLQGEYGLDPATGVAAELDSLSHLDDGRRETARLLRETMEHYVAGGARQDAKAHREALDRIIREQAFTVLNRLCALRMAEARGLLIESIGKGHDSKGFALYHRVAGPALGETGDAYRAFLFSIFDEFAVDLPALFDRYSPQGRLFPRDTVLRELLALINAADIEPLWAEDETIGWIYQYFNSKEERQKMRAESSAPRNSRELAVRNQFFTPRYVVEFLTDNTLGRIWYEMTKGETALADACRYLVRRPAEVFLAEGEVAPTGVQADEDLSQEELLRQPVFILHRPLKDPRDIKMLDPACGSMHFGLYAFDLYERIYDEAWEIEAAQGARALARPDGMQPLTESYRDKEAFLRDVPRLILAHNIHGIDIDPRAVQIAGLSLWLRAQRSWQAAGVAAADRPIITRSNVVVAEPMPGEREMLDEFAATLEPAVVGELVKVVFEKMKLAGEAGSLLKIEEELQTAIDEARARYNAEVLQRKMDAGYLPGLAPERETTLLDLMELPDAEAFWDEVEEQVLAALANYAAQIEGRESYRRRLFAHDAARGFAFIDLCRKRYDVVLMNPPFGQPTDQVYQLMRERFDGAHQDIYASFVRAGLSMGNEGRTGVISSRAFLLAPRLDRFRKQDVLPHIELLTDFGLGVMDDAYVESAAYVLNGLKSDCFLAIDQRPWVPNHSAEKLLTGIQQPARYCIPAWFSELPKARILYTLPHGIRSLMRSDIPFEPNVGTAREGMKSFHNERYLRLWWEVEPIKIGKGLEWTRLAKGGGFSFYYSDLPLLLRWADSGAELRATNKRINGTTAQVRQASNYWYVPGATYSKRSAKGFSARALPADTIFTSNGPAVLLNSTQNLSNSVLVGWLNSRMIRALLHLQANFGDYSTGSIKSLPWFGETDDERLDGIRNLAKRIIHLKSYLYSSNESATTFGSRYFTLLTSAHEVSLTEKSIQIEQEISDASGKLDEVVWSLYGITDRRWTEDVFGETAVEDESAADDEEEDEMVDPGYGLYRGAGLISFVMGSVYGRWDIRYATGEKTPPELPDPFASVPACPPGMLQSAKGLPAQPADVPSDYPLRISWPGVLVDDEGHPEDIVARVREALAVIWTENADAIEGEACAILKVEGLREYFARPDCFFADHLSRYSKSRRAAPIYWPLSSANGAYTVWLYYHRLTDQTLYHAVNDFVDPKLKRTSEDGGRLRARSNRSKVEEKELERLIDLEAELKTFREELLRVATFWRPNLNDGVQITAAPLWRLFRHKPWQKRLRETWEKLETGDYDWAHLAYSIWPDRVRGKCVTDKSLAIAHDLEHLYVEPSDAPKKKRKVKAVEEDLEETADVD